MAAEVEMRARPAAGTAVRWVALLLLLLLLFPGSHPALAAALDGGHVTVKVKRYFSFHNSEFDKYGGEVSYAKSAMACARNGGYLSADQTAAAHQSITDFLRPTGRVLDAVMFTFMGGDAEYSVNTQRCTPGKATASLGCVYQWNQGAFADPLAKGRGVAFYRGSRYTVEGNGPMNGYTPRWGNIQPHFGQPYVISRLLVKKPAQTIVWVDGAENPRLFPTRPERHFGIVCEVQDTFTITTTRPPATTTRPPATTTRPPTTTTRPPTTTTTRPLSNTSTLPPDEVVAPWAQTHWYVLVLAVVLPLLAALALIISIWCCCCGPKEPKWVEPMVLREVSGGVRHGSNERWRRGLGSFEDPVFPMCPSRNQGNGPQQSSWMTPPAAAAYATPSFRLSRCSSRRRTSDVFANVEVLKGDEIVEDGNDASLGSSRKLRRNGPSGSVVTWEDVEAIEL